MKVTDTKLSSILKTNENPNLFLLYGEESFLIKTFVNKIIDKYLQDRNDDFNFIKFDENPNLTELENSINSLPVFAEYRIILLSAIDFEKYNADDIKNLILIFSDIPTSSIVIIANDRIDIKKAKTKKVITAAEKHGYIVEFKFLSPIKVSEMIIKKTVRSGIRISKENAVYIAELTLCDLTLISNEIDKLCNYTQKGDEITKNAIDLLVAKQLDVGIYDLTNAIIQNNSNKAFSILGDLLYEGHASVVIFSAIAGTFVDYYTVKLGIMHNKNVNSIALDFNYPGNRSWIIGKIIGVVNNLKLEYIRKCLMILSKTDLMLKSSPADHKLVIEKTMTQLIIERC